MEKPKYELDVDYPNILARQEYFHEFIEPNIKIMAEAKGILVKCHRVRLTFEIDEHKIVSI